MKPSVSDATQMVLLACWEESSCGDCQQVDCSFALHRCLRDDRQAML